MTTNDDAPVHTSFSLSRRIDSFRYAARGLVSVFRTQHNAWIHAIAAALAVGIGAWLGVDHSDWLWIILAITLVWTAEAMNTAIESLADGVTREQDPAIARAKDAAAGAVLVSAIGAALIGVLVLGPGLLEKF